MKLVHHCKSLLLLVVTAGYAQPHNGPPFPMISDRRMGPCIISLWTHPDVGTGTFFVVANAAPGAGVPKDLKFEIGVRPVTGRLPEQFYRTAPQDDSGQTHYYAWVPFDKEELWRINLRMQSSEWNGSITGDVNVTPVGLGAWDLLLFSLPFLGIGFLWFMGMRRKRRLPVSR